MAVLARSRTTATCGPESGIEDPYGEGVMTYAAALTAEAEIRPRPRAVGQALRIVAAAEASMEADLARPIYTEQLCAALGVSARCLHDAFHAALGTSPHAYLRSRRLMLVRRALLSREDGLDLVTSVALGHGFWHLGHFAHDYRALFGELPSETLALRGAKGSAHGRPRKAGDGAA